MSRNLDPLISQHQLFLGRNLRHVGEESEGYPRYKVAQRCGRCAFPPGHVGTFVANKCEPSCIRLPGNNLFAPVFNRNRFGEDFNVAHAFSFPGYPFLSHCFFTPLYTWLVFGSRTTIGLTVSFDNLSLTLNRQAEVAFLLSVEANRSRCR